MRLRNRTACGEAEAFIREAAGAYRTEGLCVHLRYSGDRSSSLYGYFRDRENRIVAAVNQTVPLPALLRFVVGTQVLPVGDFRPGQDEEMARRIDELLAWVFFHEFHHFLCHTRQRTLDWETTANAFAFGMLRKFKAGRAAAPTGPAVTGTVLMFREPAGKPREDCAVACGAPGP